jgi:mycothiol synthase
MTITQRPYTGFSDLQRMADLVYVHPDQFLHLTDLPYRLSSWSLDDPANGRLWENERGDLLAWAVIQFPWLELDYIVHPSAHQLEAEVFAWAALRCQEIATQQGEPFTLYLSFREDRSLQPGLLEANGFNAADEARMVYLVRPLNHPLEPSALPESFTARPLLGQSEVEAYVELHRAAFGSKYMTIDWRRRSLTMPQYNPELDLFIIAPDGRPAAFCIGWIHGGKGQVEPLGVHPDFQGLGLGRAILHEGLRRLQQQGASEAYVDSWAGNETAINLYQSDGFRKAYESTVYFRQFEV